VLRPGMLKVIEQDLQLIRMMAGWIERLSSDGKRLKAIAFRAMGTELGELLLSERQLPLHVAGRLTIDDWSGARVPCLQIEDVAAVS